MDTQTVRFGFKSTKKRDALNNIVLDKEGKEIVIPAPPAIDLQLPQFNSVDDFLEIAATSEKDENGKEKSKQVLLVFEALNAIINEQAKNQLEEAKAEGKDMWPTYQTTKDTEGKEVKTLVKEADLSWLNLDKLSWAAIAALPPKTRGISGIPEETWKAFADDYIEVIQHHGKSEEQAKMGASHFLNKFAKIRGSKKMVSIMLNNLQIWSANTEKGVELMPVYENLISKANLLMQEDEDAIVASV